MHVLYRDHSIIAVEKPAKQFVHPMPGEPDSKNCLLFDVRDYCKTRVYAINRLDRPVSGITLFAFRPEIVHAFQEIWHLPSTQKKYLCLHRGKLEQAGQFDSSLTKRGAFASDARDIKQDSLTLYQPLQHFPKYFCTFSEVEIKTGRYHQIRRHFRKAVMPIIGDRKHGKGPVNRLFAEEFQLNQIFLHCHYLKFSHPETQEEVCIHSPLPASLTHVLTQLEKDK